MTDTAPTADYSAEDLAWFAKHYGNTEWMVYVAGPDEIHTHANPDLDEDDPANPPLIERTAHVLAKSINELHASIEARDPSPFNPSFHATVFHRGAPVTAPFDSDVLMAEPFERRDLNPIARVRDFLHVHVRVHGVSAPIAVIDESGEPGGHRWVLTAEDLGRALVPANRLRREELGLGPRQAADAEPDEGGHPTVTEVRTALIREASDFYHRRQTHHRTMHDLRLDVRTDAGPLRDAAFDAYEGLVAAGCFAEALATVLRIVEERHPETAADLAVLIHDVQENGNDCLDGANLDVWQIIEREREAAKNAPAVQVPGQQEIPAVLDAADDDDAPTCRDCGTWPCARHATDADRAEHERATGSDEAETGGEPCRPCGGQGFWYTPGGEETVDCLLCGGTGVAGGAEQ